LRFEWDPEKARINELKHGVSFSEACCIFSDKSALSILNGEHLQKEERWITLGMAPEGKLILAIHTFRTVKGREVVRIISARKATKREARQYGRRRRSR